MSSLIATHGFDPQRLRRRLSGQMAAIDDPRFAGFTPAAVLVPVVIGGAEPTLLLTRRSAHLHDHPGQIAFPGGRVDAGDATPEATALREAHEEIGIPPERIELLGRLPEYFIAASGCDNRRKVVNFSNGHAAIFGRDGSPCTTAIIRKTHSLSF